MDRAFSSRDSRGFLQHFSRDVEVTIGDKNTTVRNYSSRIAKALTNKRYENMSQSTKLTRVSRLSPDRLKVWGLTTREIQTRRATTLSQTEVASQWRRSSAGWVLEKFSVRLRL